MNAANYNWTEPINRASDKPGEIHINTLGPTEAALLAIDLDDSARNYEQMVNPNPKTYTWGEDVGSSPDFSVISSQSYPFPTAP